MNIIKIVGFKVGKDKSTCYYKVEVNLEDELDAKDSLGHYMFLALKKSDFVSVRK